MKEIIDKIKEMLKEAESQSNNSAMGYDEGWYNGKMEAFEEVLELLTGANIMTVPELGELMVKHGLIIRAVPNEHSFRVEVRHKDKHPNGIVKYSEDFKRDMLHVTESNGSLAGKFIIEQKYDRGAIVDFTLRNGKKSYNSIGEAIVSIVK